MIYFNAKILFESYGWLIRTEQVWLDQKPRNVQTLLTPSGESVISIDPEEHRWENVILSVNKNKEVLQVLLV